MMMCRAGSSTGAAAPVSESNGKPASSSGPVNSPSIGAAALVSESNSKPASSSGPVEGDQAFSCEQCRCSLWLQIPSALCVMWHFRGQLAAIEYDIDLSI